MKTYRHLFKDIVDPEVVAQCALDAAEGKLKRPEVRQFFENFDITYSYVIECATDPNYKPCEDNQHEIIDGANNKQREIEKPNFCPEQVLHHMLVEPFKKVLMNGLYEQVYGCLPSIEKTVERGKTVIHKFGPHAAIKKLTRWAQIGKKVYAAETDIHHAYASVHIGTLARQMARVIKDDDWLSLTYKFLHYYPETDPLAESVTGLVLGHYTSPWFFNFYLKEFDHAIARIPEVHYLRFADNMFLVGTNKRKVHAAMDIMRAYLHDNLYMTLNSCTQVYRFEYPCKPKMVKNKDGRVEPQQTHEPDIEVEMVDTKSSAPIIIPVSNFGLGTPNVEVPPKKEKPTEPVSEAEKKKKEKVPTRGRAINALGAVIHFNRVTLRKSILERMRRKAIHIYVKGPEKRTWHDAASMISRMGWIRMTDTFEYYKKYIKPYLNFGELKAKLRHHSKKLSKISEERRNIINAGLENSTRLARAKAERVRRELELNNGLPAQEY